MRSWALLLCAAGAFAAPVSGVTTALRHKWDTVRDVMTMHGKFGDAPPADEFIQFAAKNYYGMTTIGAGCGGNLTMEEKVLQVLVRLKAANPSMNTGMYYRSDMATELAECSWGSAEWNAHPEYKLLQDNKSVALKHGNPMIDYSNPKSCGVYFDVLVRLANASLPSGKPVLDYVYLDGPGGPDKAIAFADGIGPARSAQLQGDKMAFAGRLQATYNAMGRGQNVILNSMDDIATTEMFSASGAAGVMFDHHSALQFIDKNTGAFDIPKMEDSYAMMASPLLKNMTVQVKGWPGPIVAQIDKYPPTLPQPVTEADFKKVSGDRFNSELAFFLLIAEETNFWCYSWFWGIADYAPKMDGSTVPDEFYPDASCQLGAPTGPMQKGAGASTYTREYEHASVFVDLTNRTNSKVDFKGSC